MYWFMIHATPPRPRAHSGGAYVICWINFAIQDGAELLAKHYIREAGWVPGDFEEVRIVDRDDYGDEPEVQYFDEAAKDGACVVFH